MEISKTIKTYGSLSVIKTLNEIKKFKPRNFCQFKFLFECVLLSAIAQQAIKKLKGGKKLRKTKFKQRSSRLRLRKRKTKRIGGTKDEDDFVNHLIQLYSTIESFHNYNGNCSLNSLAVLRGIDSDAFEELFMAYSSLLNEKLVADFESITHLLTNSNIDWQSNWITTHFENDMSAVEFIIFLKSNLHLICSTQSKTELFTFLIYKSKNYASTHAVAVWYTSTKQVILIDIQNGVSNNQIYLYCEDPLNNLPEGLSKKPNIFTFLSLHDYIENYVQLTSYRIVNILSSAILKVDQFLNSSRTSSKFDNLLLKDYAATANFDAPDNGRNQLEVPRIINYYFKSMPTFVNAEDQDINFFQSVFNDQIIMLEALDSHEYDQELENARNLKILFDKLVNLFKASLRETDTNYKTLVFEIQQLITKNYGNGSEIEKKFTTFLERSLFINYLQTFIDKLKQNQKAIYGNYENTIPSAVESVKFKKYLKYYPDLFRQKYGQNDATQSEGSELDDVFGDENLRNLLFK
jgi:hypothetical protein